ncbi:histidinol-phosphatase HisJ family protein [Peribacillus psychrosaccharolyticus]|uniref:Histidinol-phosphatase n=2 Tax=Peribacillus psychrosaccharolyticus TaxID=1407 RepID=A0A974NNT7_PERPY|nr:histidinol-phosphatase HisJ family protein [Peribacillus psychrosaccharolyticus]MEC2054047.1 histidinol-phosphatase HisJ family protein [Peribacillus psychrosaccharolyticus]MED3742338.1 histidinol-phosphatase HisJ family protein [Peribacillus psychrosaccharolyticus]QQT01309.1 histidinol-phosphatase HisJ family protein [Peribacillus psychrosaccharolyticus]
MHIMDYHHHTNHSFDSKASMKDVCMAAIEKGIKELCFTEHFSVNPLAPTYGHMNFDRYFSEINECREEFGSQLIIKAGIELCEPHLLKEKYESILTPLNLDFILGSVHNIDNLKLSAYLKQVPADKAYQGYFEEVYKMVCTADIDVIAHLDLLKRYAVKTIGMYTFEDHKDVIEAILKKAIDRNIGIEINTSGLRGNLKQSLPSIDVLSLYHQLGGEILTLGSDSHFVKDVGANIEDAAAMAKQCGFTHVYKFENRIPMKIELT